MKLSRIGLIVLTGLAFTKFAGAQTNPDVTSIESFVDSMLNTGKYDPSRQGNVNFSAVSGDASRQILLWTQGGGSPVQITTLTDNGSEIWMESTMASSNELGGTLTPNIAVFAANDGHFIASGSLPSGRAFMTGFQWTASNSIQPLPAAKPFVPVMRVNSQSVSDLIKVVAGEFDEVAMKNAKYAGLDRNGENEQMTWQQTGTAALTIKVQSPSASSTFVLSNASIITQTNIEQYQSDSEGSFLVIQEKVGSGISELWVHSFEGATTIRIKTGSSTAEFYFDADSPQRVH